MGSSQATVAFLLAFASAIALAAALQRVHRQRRRARAGGEPDRVLSTVVFTDIVSSTRHVAAVGDREWRQVLDHHDAVTREQLVWHRGEEVRHTGDGFLATFDSPALAVEWVAATMESLRPVGLELRAGVHAGEVERRAGGVDGIAVHIGARVCDRAEPNEILVSQTVRDAAIGSDVEFLDRGRHELDGVPSAWRLYAARTPA